MIVFPAPPGTLIPGSRFPVHDCDPHQRRVYRADWFRLVHATLRDQKAEPRACSGNTIEIGKIDLHREWRISSGYLVPGTPETCGIACEKMFTRKNAILIAGYPYPVPISRNR